MEPFEKEIETVRAILDKPATSYRSRYEQQNAYQAQFERLYEAQTRLEGFKGGRSGDVRKAIAELRDRITQFLTSSSDGSSNAAGSGGGDIVGAGSGGAGGMPLPGSEEWLRQLQAEDEVDQEHERRAAKHRGRHRKEPGGSKKSAHGGGRAAGEAESQRDTKNANKELGAYGTRLVHLVHPTSCENLDAAGAAASSTSPVVVEPPSSASSSSTGSPPGPKNAAAGNRSPAAAAAAGVSSASASSRSAFAERHETHKDCHFSVISQFLLNKPSNVTCVENLPLVEIEFEKQQKVTIPSSHTQNYSSLANHFGFIVGSSAQRSSGKSSRNSSRRSTPARRGGGGGGNNNATKSPSNRQQNRSPQISGKKQSSRPVSPAQFDASPATAAAIGAPPSQHRDEVVDIRTKVTMYRTVFDTMWSLSAASAQKEINLMDCSVAETLAERIPVPIGGGGCAEGRSLGGKAEAAAAAAAALDQQERTVSTDSSVAMTSAAVRAPTAEYVSPTSNDVQSFPTLSSGDTTAAIAASSSSANPWKSQQATTTVRASKEGGGEEDDDDEEVVCAGDDDDDDDGEDFDYDDDDDDDGAYDDDDDDYDVQKLASRLAAENASREGGEGGSAAGVDADDLMAATNKGIMATNKELAAPGASLSLISNISMAPWTIIMCQGGYFAAAVFVQGVPVIHKAFHRYVVRRKQGGKQSNQEGIAGSAGSQIRKAQEKKFGEDVQVLLDAWRALIDSSWFIFFAAPSPSNRKLLTQFSPAITRAAVQEKPQMYEAARDVVAKNELTMGAQHRLRVTDVNSSPVQLNDYRVKSVPMTTKRPVFGEVMRIYETLSRCTLRVYYTPSSDAGAEVETPHLKP